MLDSYNFFSTSINLKKTSNFSNNFKFLIYEDYFFMKSFNNSQFNFFKFKKNFQFHKNITTFSTNLINKNNFNLYFNTNFNKIVNKTKKKPSKYTYFDNLDVFNLDLYNNLYKNKNVKSKYLTSFFLKEIASFKVNYNLFYFFFKKKHITL